MGRGNIHNYYEYLVQEKLKAGAWDASLQELDADQISDVACVALNHLPPRYIRHEVDLLFYMAPDEQKELELEVRGRHFSKQYVCHTYFLAIASL